jgi:hypothetical protein
MLEAFHRMWEIVEQPRFATELRALVSNPVRADDFVDGAKTALARNPQLGTKIGKSIWFLPMGVGTLSIYYRFDEHKVYLESIRSSKAPE